jgi:uncharacterized tellurite resistance protein B-like protein
MISIVLAYIKKLLLMILMVIPIVTMLCAVAPNREISVLITVNVLFMLVLLPIVVLLHELGHVASARLVGVRSNTIVLGTGKHVRLLRLGKVRILVTDKLRFGCTSLSEFPRRRTKPRLALIYSGGILAHLLIIGMTFAIRGGNMTIFPPNGIDIAWSFSASNAYVLVLALLPLPWRIGDSRVPSDGLRLIMLPFMNQKKLAELKLSTYGTKVIEKLLDGKIETAQQDLERLVEQHPETSQLRLLLTRIYTQRLKFDKALKNLRELIERDKKAEKDPVILNLLSWNLLLTDMSTNLAEAEKYAARAYKLQIDPGITNTVALIRMLKGESEQAETLLKIASQLKKKVNRETNHPLNFYLLSILAKKRGEQYEAIIKRFLDNVGLLTKDELFLVNELNHETEVVARCMKLKTETLESL